MIYVSQLKSRENMAIIFRGSESRNKGYNRAIKRM